MSKLDQQLAELQRLRTEYDRLKAELPYDEQAHRQDALDCVQDCTMASWWHEGRGEQTEANEQMDLAVTRMTNIVATLRSKKATEDRLNAAVIKVTSSNGSVTLPRNKPHKAYMLHLPPDGTLTVVVENIDAELDFDVTRDLSRVQANSSAHSVTVKPESYVKENGNVGSGEIIIRTGNHNATTLQVLDVQITEKPFPPKDTITHVR